MGFERKKIPKCSEILRQKESWQICLIFPFDTGTSARSQHLQSRLVWKAQKAAEGSVRRWGGDGGRAGHEAKAQLGRQERHWRGRLRNCSWQARQTAEGRLLSTIAVYGLWALLIVTMLISSTCFPDTCWGHGFLPCDFMKKTALSTIST